MSEYEQTVQLLAERGWKPDNESHGFSKAASWLVLNRMGSEYGYVIAGPAADLLAVTSGAPTVEQGLVSLKDVEAAVKGAIGLVLVRREQESVRGPIIRYHDVPDEKAAQGFWEAVQARLHPQEEVGKP